MDDDIEEYIITGIKNLYKEGYIYTVIPTNINKNVDLKITKFKSNIKLNLYAKIKYRVQEQNFDIISNKDYNKVTKVEYEDIIQKFIENISTFINDEKSSDLNIKNNILNKLTVNMLSDLKEIALIIIKHAITGAPIIIRFHNDSDGSSGALALYKALVVLFGQKYSSIENLSIFWRLNKSIKYSMEEFYEDTVLFELYTTVEKPTVIIIDFGTTPESEDTISLANNYNIIILDHHPVYERFPVSKLTKYINPWNYSGDSNYTAGFLVGVLAKIIIGNNIKIIDKLMSASLIGDHSIYADINDKEAEKISNVLDYLTGKAQSFSIEKTLGNIEDESKLKMMFIHSTRIFEEALNSSLKYIRHYTGYNGTNIFVLDFNHVERIEEDFPLPGRFSTKLHDNLESLNGSNITIVHYGNYISLRISSNILDYIDIMKTFEKLKSINKNIYSFGGHKSAASVRINKFYITSVLKNLLELLGVTNIKKF
ncbi:MAG: hypothetical protein M1538_00340 [Candidatus Marsarchaeota archaeon]|jgi:RecJ-like exonuclease|nr:hypothetical protein [Candidatus Marsarchaeota archaeon]